MSQISDPIAGLNTQALLEHACIFFYLKIKLPITDILSLKPYRCLIRGCLSPFFYPAGDIHIQDQLCSRKNNTVFSQFITIGVRITCFFQYQSRLFPIAGRKIQFFR